MPEDGLDDERRRRFGPYVRCLADEMGLRDWTACIKPDTPENPNHIAEVDCVYGAKWANVFLSEAFFRKDEAEQRETICHELIHAHLAPMTHFLRKVLDGSEVEAFMVTMEYAIDGMATEWARRLPLPSEVKPARSKPKMGRQKPKPAPTAQPKPKAGPKPPPRGKKGAK